MEKLNPPNHGLGASVLLPVLPGSKVVAVGQLGITQRLQSRGEAPSRLDC